MCLSQATYCFAVYRFFIIDQNNYADTATEKRFIYTEHQTCAGLQKYYRVEGSSLRVDPFWAELSLYWR